MSNTKVLQSSRCLAMKFAKANECLLESCERQKTSDCCSEVFANFRGIKDANAQRWNENKIPVH
jgi:hypothetical protein